MRALVAVLGLTLTAAASQLPAHDPNRVYAYITVSGPRNVPLPRLGARDFHVLEDGVEQKVDYFSVQDGPVSVGIVWGAGTGFDDPAPDPNVRECPSEFLRNSGPGAEFFILAGDTVIQSFTTNLALVPKNYARSGSSTDTVFIGLDVLKEAAHSRKILFIVNNFAGGGGGLLEPSYMESVSIRQGVQIHVGSFSAEAGAVNLEGFNLFGELTDLTGGSYYTGPPSTVYCADLAKELRVQYLVGYRPSNAAKDGKWRRLSVRLEQEEAGPRLRARIKRGYYAAKPS
jgi:Ca-activated chloride channel family protein